MYRYSSSYFYNDKIIYLQLFGYSRPVIYSPGYNYSELMLSIYKSWIYSVDKILDKGCPKDKISRRLEMYIYDGDFLKRYLCKASIRLNFQ